MGGAVARPRDRHGIVSRGSGLDAVRW